MFKSLILLLDRAVVVLQVFAGQIFHQNIWEWYMNIWKNVLFFYQVRKTFEERIISNQKGLESRLDDLVKAQERTANALEVILDVIR